MHIGRVVTARMNEFKLTRLPTLIYFLLINLSFLDPTKKRENMIHVVIYFILYNTHFPNILAKNYTFMLSLKFI